MEKIPETENPQEAKGVCPGKPERHVDTFRKVHNVGFLAGRLICRFGILFYVSTIMTHVHTCTQSQLNLHCLTSCG